MGRSGKPNSSIKCVNETTRQAFGGFSLIELIVVIGAIMVVLGLLLPSLGKSRKTAENVVALAGIRSNATLIHAYAAENSGIFPIASNSPWACAEFWMLPVLQGGFVGSVQDTYIGPSSTRTPCTMTAAATMNPAQMVRGRTLPINEVKSVPLTLARVAFPADKGLLHANTASDAPTQPWCCGVLVAAPVAFFDGSASEYAWGELLSDGLLQVQDNVGFPVLSTWGGLESRDRVSK